ncbi:MAG: DUF4194 domain-containing protein [Gammaproteobacteria bacterium]|nr:DUF4194 domain-containing protein [Gammaproteobacteria bacterium]
MLLDELKEFNKETQETFKKICNQLLFSNYLSKDKRDNNKAYYFVLNYKKYFDEFFEILGDELILNKEIGAIQLKNNYYSGTLKLKKEETFIALILRILYQEKLINTTLDNTVVITVDEIHNKYQSFGFKRKIFKTELVSALRLFKKYNVIDNIGDLEMSSTKILIFSTITLLIPIHNIQEVYNYVNQLEVGKGEDEE